MFFNDVFNRLVEVFIFDIINRVHVPVLGLLNQSPTLFDFFEKLRTLTTENGHKDTQFSTYCSLGICFSSYTLMEISFKKLIVVLRFQNQ